MNKNFDKTFNKVFFLFTRQQRYRERTVGDICKIVCEDVSHLGCPDLENVFIWKMSLKNQVDIIFVYCGRDRPFRHLKRRGCGLNNISRTTHDSRGRCIHRNRTYKREQEKKESCIIDTGFGIYHTRVS